MTAHDDVLRRHGAHPVRVREVIEETADSRTFVLDVPAEFAYRAGQFCTFHVPVDGGEVLRCYSMSSAPSVDLALAVTVKRVPGGLASNWLIDRVHPGDELLATKPAGVFCPHDGDRPVVGFAGGSGITPVISIAKEVLATTDRRVRLLYANRDASSVIFRAELDRLAETYGDRLDVRHHLDDPSGYLTVDDVRAFLGTELDVDLYVCGPTPFMDLVESTVLAAGIDPARISIERFATPPSTADEPTVVDAPATESLTLIVKKRRTTVTYTAGDTILDTARRGGVATPFSCEAGNCASCMAFLKDGTVTMRVNNALSADEVDEGWVLTCQAIPTSAKLTVEWD